MKKLLREVLKVIKGEGVVVKGYEQSTGTGHVHVTCEYLGASWVYITGVSGTAISPRKLHNVKADIRRAKKVIHAEAARSAQRFARRPLERGARKLSPLGKTTPS